jgi:hypothetical protein
MQSDAYERDEIERGPCLTLYSPGGRVTSRFRERVLVGGEASFRPPSLRWLRLPRLGLPAEAPIAREVVGLGVDVERAVGGGVWHRPMAPAVVTYPRRRSPDVHVSLVAGGGQGPTSAVAGVRGSAPERTRERVAAVERRTEAEQPPSRRARSAQPPSRAQSVQPLNRARRTTRRRSPGCAPRCKFPTSDLLL